tara:strand:- start:2782 stop:4146 length:1365 start_codon:yes stop_codon:yes gene_type:complete
MPKDSLYSISPIDGRYHHKTKQLEEYFSEFALIKYRLEVELKWLILLSKNRSLDFIPSLSAASEKKILKILSNFDLKEAKKIKNIEQKTNHDVKAVEIYIVNKLNDMKLSKYSEFVHFGCTSEDINNLSYALMVGQFINDIFIPKNKELKALIKSKAKKWKNISMLSHTHGQPASPTTLGKEFINYFERISYHLSHIENTKQRGKFNGASGNFNAHVVAANNFNWLKLSKKFVNSLGLDFVKLSTQIELKDAMAHQLSNIHNLNNVLLDFSKDIWLLISKSYLKQKIVKGEVGSSTMPHKVNPIDFENAEGNLSLAQGLLISVKDKIQISRLQRDLSDSTVMRNIGSIFAYIFISYESLLKGIEKLEPNNEIIKQDLDNTWEILTEAIQTILRKNGHKNSYEIIKQLSRGKKLDYHSYIKIIDDLEINKIDKKALLELTPLKYTGIAKDLVSSS